MLRATRLWLVVVPAVLLGAAGTAVTPHYVLVPGSQFRIDGTSNLGPWTCTASDLAGAATPAPHGALDAHVHVRVRSFDCGRARMNEDFRDALRAREHPEIRFELDRAVILGDGARPRAWVPVRAFGRIRLAGTERPVTIAVRGREEADGRVRVRGQLALRMTDFGVTPPTALGGVVRTRDAVVVAFDLRATAQP